jgi:hypothetical protein
MIYSIPFELDEIVLLKTTKVYNTSLYQIEYLNVNIQDIPEEGTILGKITLLEDNINAPRSYKYLHIQVISNSIDTSLNNKETFVSPNNKSAWYLPEECISKI